MSSRIRVPIVAGKHIHAKQLAEKLNLTSYNWKYVSCEIDLAGYHGIVFIESDTAHRLPEYRFLQARLELPDMLPIYLSLDALYGVKR